MIAPGLSLVHRDGLLQMYLLLNLFFIRVKREYSFKMPAYPVTGSK